MLLNASGCLDALTAPETALALDAFVTKTVTPLPRGGNDPVRIAETDVGMLNSIGLANPGIERFLAEHLPRLRELGVPVWVSVGGFSAQEYADTCARLEDVRATGAAQSDGERQHGAGSVASPIFGFDGQVIGAISVCGPAYRMSADVRSSTVPLVREAADQISRALGWRGGLPVDETRDAS